MDKLTWTDRLKVKLYLLVKLPAAFWSGIHLLDIDANVCSVGIRYSWRNTNPFRSIYFACLSMAAEFSTGFPAFHYIRSQRKDVSMLVVGQEAAFLKKAVGRIRFECRDVPLLTDTIDKVVSDQSPTTVKVKSTGINQDGEEVAVFYFTWSFKARA